MRVAVLGHVEWVEFAAVSRVPVAGEIVQTSPVLAVPAGGGAVAAVALARWRAESVLFRWRQEGSFADKLLCAMRLQFGGHVEPRSGE